LYKWLKDEAKNTGCKFIHLDSAVHRGDTHRFYLDRAWLFQASTFGKKLMTYNKWLLISDSK